MPVIDFRDIPEESAKTIEYMRDQQYMRNEMEAERQEERERILFEMDMEAIKSPSQEGEKGE